MSRYYRAACWKDGIQHSVSFQADNVMLAFDHAARLCADNDAELHSVGFAGRTEPTDDFGTLKPLVAATMLKR